MRGLTAFLAVTLSLTGSANAYLKAGPVGYGHWLKATTVQDGMATSLSAAYSFRKVRSAYAGSAVKLRRTTGGTSDIGFTATGDFDAAAAATFCAATTCFIDTWYDQSGNARHLTNPAASQLDYVADCIGDKPCARTSGARHLVAASPVAPAGAQSLSVVGRVDAAEQQCTLLNAGKQQVVTLVGGFWQVSNSTQVVAGPAVTGSFHALAGVINGAASVVNIDGVEAAGTASVVTTADNLYVAYGSAGANPCSISEAFWWGGYALTQPERLALTQNQRNYWTPLPLDNFATPAAAYSMRRLKSSYTGPAIRLQRTSDSAFLDVNFLSFTSFTGAPLDAAAVNSFCNATICIVDTWYDQSGNGRHALRSGSTATLIPNCLGGLPCARSASNPEYLVTSNLTTSATAAIGVVANRASGAGYCVFAGRNAVFVQSNAAANTWQISDSGTGNTITFAASDAAWHATVANFAGASTVVRVDATETTGTVGVTTGSGPIQIAQGAYVAPSECNLTEAVIWDGYTLPLAERAALTANQKSFWGTP